jgi:hypothetical protein
MEQLREDYLLPVKQERGLQLEILVQLPLSRAVTQMDVNI